MVPAPHPPGPRSPSPLRSLAWVALLAGSTASCGIDADDMNDSGYRALAFELPDEATKYFGAARELIEEAAGDDGDPALDPEYARMRRGELLVEAWLEPAAALRNLEQAASDSPELFDADAWEEQMRAYAAAGHLTEALAVARHAAAVNPDSEALRSQLQNLESRLGPEPALPPFAPEAR